MHLAQLLDAWQQSGAARRHHVYIFTRPDTLPAIAPKPESGITLCPQQLGPGKLVWEQTRLPMILTDYNLDVLFCPGGIIPFRSTLPAVMMMQNAAPFCETIGLRNVTLYDYAYFWAFGRMARLSASRASRVIFISRYYQRYFEQRFGFPPARADVIYHGRDTLDSRSDPAVLERLGVRRPYILSVSHLYPYKNIPALIKGYALAHERLKRQGLRLFLAGKPVSASHFRSLRAMVSKLGLEDWVSFLGPVPHADIGPLLAGCEFLAFQSTCENCPNTLIEALVAGAPIACSNAGVMPEIAGDAARYFNPFDPASIACTLTELAENDGIRQLLRQRALKRAHEFPTWAEVGKLTLRSLELAAEQRAR